MVEALYLMDAGDKVLTKSTYKSILPIVVINSEYFIIAINTMYFSGHVTLFFVNRPYTSSLITGKF